MLTAGAGEVASQTAAAARVELAVERVTGFLQRLSEELGVIGRLVRRAADRIREVAAQIRAVLRTTGERTPGSFRRVAPAPPTVPADWAELSEALASVNAE